MFISRIQSQIQRVYINVYIQDTELDTQGIYKCIFRIQSQIQRVYINVYMNELRLHPTNPHKLNPSPIRTSFTRLLSRRVFKMGDRGVFGTLSRGGALICFFLGGLSTRCPPMENHYFYFYYFYCKIRISTPSEYAFDPYDN